MKRHHKKNDFNVIAVTVISLEVLAFISFIVGMSLAVYNMFMIPPILTNIQLILLVTGSLIVAFILLASAEFLQLLLKIEVNTRKTEKILESVQEKIKPKKKVAKKK